MRDIEKGGFNKTVHIFTLYTRAVIRFTFCELTDIFVNVIS